jgi:hypothetical protein
MTLIGIFIVYSLLSVGVKDVILFESASQANNANIVLFHDDLKKTKA